VSNGASAAGEDAALGLPSAWTLDDARRFVAGARWVFAKTMPDAPHWYTLRAKGDGRSFEAMVLFIRSYGYDGRYGGAAYRYLDLGGWTYWTMGAPLAETMLINRGRWVVTPDGPVRLTVTREPGAPSH